MDPVKRSRFVAPLYLPRPITIGPLVANGVVSVAVPARAPLTYNVIAPVVESYTPTRCVHTPSAGAVDDIARMTVELLTSALLRQNAHRLSALSYCRQNAEPMFPSCETAVSYPAVEARFSQADTLKLCVVSSTGAAVVMAPVPLKAAAPPDQDTPEPRVPGRLPGAESAAVVPDVSSSFHQPAGPPEPTLYTVREVIRPIGSYAASVRPTVAPLASDINVEST